VTARYHHRHTSIKALLLFIPIAAIVGGSFVLVAQEPRPAIAMMLAVITFVAIVVALFSTFTVQITGDELVFGFLFGVMRRRIPLADIAHATRIMLPWWYGTGVKLGPKRISYLIWPGPAVALTLKSGRTVQVGTEDADALLAALAQAGVRAG
jgi:hypothetical protein